MVKKNSALIMVQKLDLVFILTPLGATTTTFSDGPVIKCEVHQITTRSTIRAKPPFLYYIGWTFAKYQWKKEDIPSRVH